MVTQHWPRAGAECWCHSRCQDLLQVIVQLAEQTLLRVPDVLCWAAVPALARLQVTPELAQGGRGVGKGLIRTGHILRGANCSGVFLRALLLYNLRP